MLKIIAALSGLLAGPLLHEVAVRVGVDLDPRGWPLTCQRCGNRYGLRFVCGGCGTRRLRPVATGLATAALFALVVGTFAPRWVTLGYLVFAAMTVILFLTDIDHLRIPNAITYPGTPIVAGLLVVGSILDGTAGNLPRAASGSLISTAFFFVVYLVGRGGFGFGDVKLAISLGLMAAFIGWDQLILAGMLTAAVGGVMALAVVVMGGREFPYGPPLILGTWGAILSGTTLTDLLL